MERAARLTLHATGGTVEIDGQDVSHAVRGIDLTQTAGQPPRLTLELRLDQLVCNGLADVVIPDDIEELLLRLGWSQPGASAITADTIRDPGNREAALEALRLGARLDPDWFRDLLRHEARLNGRPAPEGR